MRPWITFFSQTGTEIHNLSNELGIYPDLIVTNRSDLKGINEGLLRTTQFREHKLNKTILTFLPSKPVASNYLKILNNFKNPLITLHGYLRIIPKEICDKYEIFNLHPGLINKFPSLKGFNPQERAFTGEYKEAGCVIHKVTPGVDEGEIVATSEINIEDLTLTQVYTELHDCAFNVWKNFLTEYNINQSES